MKKEPMQVKSGLKMSTDKVSEHVMAESKLQLVLTTTMLNWRLLCVTYCAGVILETKVYGPHFRACT